MVRRAVHLVILLTLGVFACGADVDISKLPPATNRTIDFVHDIRPLFERHCYSCHGAEKQKSGYRLDVRASAMKGGDVGERPILPGDSAHSPLIQYVAGVHPDITMPPKGEALTADQVGVLRAWIDQGARWPAEADRVKVADKSDWWSFRPVVRPRVPAGAENPIDAFVLAKLREKKLAPNPSADRLTLIRRVYFDLLGLPPLPEEVEAFVKDPDARAYEKLVDRLLESPRT